MLTNTVPSCGGMRDRQNVETGETNDMGARIWIEALAFALLATVGPAVAQASAPPTNAGPVQPWGLPPLPPGVGPIEKFADVSNTPQGKFLEGGAFDDHGNLFFTDPWATGPGPNASDRAGAVYQYSKDGVLRKGDGRPEFPERDRGLAGQWHASGWRLHRGADDLRHLRHRPDNGHA